MAVQNKIFAALTVSASLLAANVAVAQGAPSAPASLQAPVVTALSADFKAQLDVALATNDVSVIGEVVASLVQKDASALDAIMAYVGAQNSAALPTAVKAVQAALPEKSAEAVEAALKAAGDKEEVVALILSESTAPAAGPQAAFSALPLAFAGDNNRTQAYDPKISGN